MGLVYRKVDNNRLLFHVPANIEDNVIRSCHDDMGHFGVETILYHHTITYRPKHLYTLCLKTLFKESYFKHIASRPKDQECLHWYILKRFVIICKNELHLICLLLFIRWHRSSNIKFHSPIIPQKCLPNIIYQNGQNNNLVGIVFNNHLIGSTNKKYQVQGFLNEI